MKNKKLLKGWILAVILFLGISAMSSNAFADTAGTANSTATITFTAGELTLVAAPSFDFGSQSIPSGTTSYPATTNTGKLSVSDLRGSGAGWSVTASLATFQNSGNTLAGSTLALSSSATAAETGTLSSAPVVSSSITLTSDGTVVAIENAATNTGKGVWDTTWGTAELTVYAGTAKTGANTSQIDWFLSDTP